MSGTSMDGVDGVLGLIGPEGQWLGSLAHAHEPFDASLRLELMALNTPGPDELHRGALAGQALARAYARVTQQLMNALPPGRSVRALGAHGQTVRHRPELGYTTQLLAPALRYSSQSHAFPPSKGTIAKIPISGACRVNATTFSTNAFLALGFDQQNCAPKKFCGTRRPSRMPNQLG